MHANTKVPENWLEDKCPQCCQPTCLYRHVNRTECNIYSCAFYHNTRIAIQAWMAIIRLGCLFVFDTFASTFNAHHAHDIHINPSVPVGRSTKQEQHSCNIVRRTNTWSVRSSFL